MSGLTHMAGVVTLPRQVVGSLRQIEFLPLSERRVLAILVINEKEVQNRILDVDRDYGEDELRRAANYLNAHFAGKTLISVREELLSGLQETRESMNRRMVDAIQIAQRVFEVGGDGQSGYCLAGETNLMDFAELSDVDKLRELFDAFSRQRDLIHLLDRCMVGSDLQIFIGEESGYQILGRLQRGGRALCGRGRGSGGARCDRSHPHGLRACHPDRRYHRENSRQRLEFTRLAPSSRVRVSSC